MLIRRRGEAGHFRITVKMEIDNATTLLNHFWLGGSRSDRRLLQVFLKRYVVVRDFRGLAVIVVTGGWALVGIVR